MRKVARQFISRSLRALASEKYERFLELSKLEIKKGGVKVGIATGDYDSKDEWLGDRDIIVATSEKTDSLLRKGSPPGSRT